MTLMTLTWIGLAWLVVATLGGMVIGRAIANGERGYQVAMREKE